MSARQAHSAAFVVRRGTPAKQSWTVDGVTSTATTGFAPGGQILWKTFPDGDSVGSTTRC